MDCVNCGGCVFLQTGELRWTSDDQRAAVRCITCDSDAGVACSSSAEKIRCFDIEVR